MLVSEVVEGEQEVLFPLELILAHKREDVFISKTGGLHKVKEVENFIVSVLSIGVCLFELPCALYLEFFYF